MMMAPEKPKVHGPFFGRVISFPSTQLMILDTRLGRQEVVLSEPHPPEVNPGDIVKVHLGKVSTLTPNRSGSTLHHETLQNPRRQKALQTRQKVESGIRAYFTSHDFLETRTPLLVPCPGMEPHIRPFQLANSQAYQQSMYLPTSPEFAMKRLLVGGLEKIFQLCPAFRDEPLSITHNPEFTLLEWYRAYATYEDIMVDVENLVAQLATQINGGPWLTYQGREISLAPPWPRLKVRDLFMKFAGVDLTQNQSAESLSAHCKRLGLMVSQKTESRPGDCQRNWDDLYFNIWLNVIEPKLPQDHAVFVTRYPASQAALSVIDQDPDGSHWARRFEVYAGGLELGNAFEELTDPVEQRRRFVKDMELRTQVYGPGFPKNPLDEDFLSALSEGMPPSSGIAMGVDRLIMLLADEPEIDYTFWLSRSASRAIAR